MADSAKAVTPQEQLPPQPMLINQNSLSKTTGFHSQNVNSASVVQDPLSAQEQLQERDNQFLMPNVSINSNQQKTSSPPNGANRDDVLMVSQVIATSGEAQRTGQSQQRGSKQKKNLLNNGEGSKVRNKLHDLFQSHTRVASNPSKPPAESVYNTPNSDQFQAFNMFHPSQQNQAPYAGFSQTQQHPMMQQPPQQVHFIAKQQKFYQISPSRAADMQVGQVPVLIDKRPYTSSQIQQVMGKRQSGGSKVQNHAIAALYLANSNKTSVHSKEVFNPQGSTMLQGTPYQPPRKRMSQNLSVPRKANNPNQVFTQLDHEQLFEETIKLKQQNYDLREESGRLKARIKMQETEMLRKDRAIEDFYQQSQFIQNAQKAGSQLAPIAQQTQKYQQETFLLMSLKKQVKQLKSELLKRDEQVSQLLKVGKVGKNSELEQELEIYKEEVARLQQQELSNSESNHAQIMSKGIQPPSTEQLFSIQDTTNYQEMLQHKESVISELTQQFESKLQISEMKLKKQSKEATDKLIDLQKSLKQQQQQSSQLETKLKEAELQIKFLNSKITSSKDATKLIQEKLGLQDQQIQSLEKKNKSLKETISKVQVQQLPVQPSEKVEAEIKFVAPIIGGHLKITDRLLLASELKHGLSLYKPTKEVEKYLQEAASHVVALLMPDLLLPKTKLDSYSGECAEKVKCDFANETMKGVPLSLQQRQFLMARYLFELHGVDAFCDTRKVVNELDKQVLKPKKSVSEEEMLDIAEMCFIKMADVLIKHGTTVREAFGKYSIPEMLPESKTILELLVPEAFFEAVKVELKIEDITDLETACLMRVLAKPELDNAIIMNEFALILENFGVPLIEGTISDDEDYIPDGAEQPVAYDLKNIDEEGISIMQDVARFLLKEYMHPREFFGKMVKCNQEIKTEKQVFRLDILSVKDFYLKVKIANIRKNLQENQSLNKELCLDKVAHPGVFNVKTFVRALEDLAEVEQERLMENEKAAEDQQLQRQGSSGLQQPDKPPATMSSALAPEPAREILGESKEPAADYSDLLKSNVDIKPEAPSFGKGRKSRRSPKPQSKFLALGTIEEAVNETQTSLQQEFSYKDDESKNQLRDSNRIDFEESGGASQHKDSMQRVDLLNRSLSGREEQHNKQSLRSDRQVSTDQLNSDVEELKSDNLDNLTPDIQLPAQETEEDDEEYDDKLQ